jgi:hypothetical protein
MKMTEQQVREHQYKHKFQCALDQPISVVEQPTLAQERWQAGEERELNALVCTDLRRRGYYVLVSRTDKESTIRRGHPDLTVMRNGKVCCIELKAAGGKLSKHQTECIDELNQSGIPTTVCWNFDEAVKFAIVSLL